MSKAKHIAFLLISLVVLTSFSFALVEDHTGHSDEHPTQQTQCCSHCCPSHNLMSSDAFVHIENIAVESTLQLPLTAPYFETIISRVYRPPIFLS